MDMLYKSNIEMKIEESAGRLNGGLVAAPKSPKGDFTENDL